MQKRDRIVKIFLHRKTGAVLLFPYVCYAAGHSAIYGNVQVQQAAETRKIGRAIISMFSAGRKADVEPPSQARKDALQRKWRHEKVTPEEIRPSFDKKSNLEEVLAQFPALTKGLAAYHRTFAVAELIERDSWTSRKLVRLVRSSFASCESAAETVRLPLSLDANELGYALVEQMIEWQS